MQLTFFTGTLPKLQTLKCSDLSLHGLPQEPLHFSVCNLGKVPVKNVNCIERFRHHCANSDCVNFVVKRNAPLPLAYRNCDYDLLRTFFAQSHYRRSHHRTCRHAVIHNDDCLTSHVQRVARATIQSLLSFKFGELSSRHFINELKGNVELRDKSLVENAYSPTANRAHRILFKAWHTKLSH